MDWVSSVADELAFFFSLNAESILRLLLAAGLGAVIGLEREASGKPAGFRTNLLICMGAALLTDVSAFVASGAENGGDPGRIAAQIVSGIGFLGAGTIMQARGSITGLTTAATLWVVAAIGMAVGAGAYVPAIIGTLLVMLALTLLGRIEDHLLPRHPAERMIRVVLEPNAAFVEGIEKQLIATGYRVRSVDVEKVQDALVASFGTEGAAGDYDRAIRTLLARDGVRQITLM